MLTLLAALFSPRPPLRDFALLDDHGRCRAFRRASQAPAGAGWVEVNETRLCWLGQTLPAGAFLIPRRRAAATRFPAYGTCPAR
ncbi:hypothetical protein [Pseudomonas mangiferae]|uniref:hypothetical protein n=1 Tax=Pseudomonas mangiferae TaxID=2593654 RepID=UPI003899C092